MLGKASGFSISIWTRWDTVSVIRRGTGPIRDHTLLLYGTIDGFISEQTYPVDRQYHEMDMAGETDPDLSVSFRSRSFTFNETINRIQPNSALVQFLESSDPVDVTAIADRTIQLYKCNTPTGQQGLTLPIPGFHFRFDRAGILQLADVT